MKEEKRKQLMSVKPLMELPNDLKLIHGDFRDKSRQIKSTSVHLIYCDPMYNKDGIELYRDLTNVANRVLVEDGSLVVYTGQFYLDRIFELLKSSGLTYWWALCIKHAENHQLVYSRNVFCEFKLLLWFCKGKRPSMIGKISDHIESRQPDKVLHKYEQSTEEAEYIIKHLTVENQLVLDPMMGSATSGVAALKLKRKFIGIEKDKDVFALAKKRIRSSKFIDANQIQL